MNQSKRPWRLGANRKPQRNWKNKGLKLSWEEKKERKKEMTAIR